MPEPLLCRPIFLVGLPASGKSTLGRALARALGAEFIDLDKYIESRFRRTVAQIFSEMGEERFRQIEHNMLHEVGEMTGVVIATGGGTPCFFDNMDYMLAAGLTLHLVTSRNRLHERLCRRRSRRPAVAALSDAEVFDYIDRISAARAPFYDRARMRVESTLLEDRSQISSTVSALLPRLLPLLNQ